MAVKEGDVLEINTDAAVGHEQRGRRPVLVVSVDELHNALVNDVGNGLLTIATRAATAIGSRATRERRQRPHSRPSVSQSRKTSTSRLMRPAHFRPSTTIGGGSL